MARKSNTTGIPMLVNLPQTGYADSGEGGLAFFFIIKPRPFDKQRQACMAGDIMWPLQDCQIKPRTWPDFLNESPRDYNHLEKYVTPIDAGLLIGSTGQSLWSDFKGEYFTPTIEDLTPEGKRLYHTLKRLYGEITLVTLLDT